MSRYTTNIFALIFFLLFLFSCTSYKKVPYLQMDQARLAVISNQASSLLRYQVDDVLSITVNSSGEPVVAADFNLPMQPAATNENSNEWNLNPGYGRQTYQVNSRGEIDFPVLGPVLVEGLSQEELEGKLKLSLRKYLKSEPVVTIRLMNCKISVLGEVNRPGQYNVPEKRINLFEALSLAGDMTIYGRRENVRIIRTLSKGDLEMVELDLTSTDITKSPYFYLKQDDVLYVEPNKARAKSSDIGSQTGILISIGSMLLTLVNLIVLISK